MPVRLAFWIGALVAVAWAISVAVQQFLSANPRPTF